MTASKTYGLPVQAPAERPSLVFCSDLNPLDYSRIVHPKGVAGAVSFCGPATSKKTGKPTWHDSRWSPYALATRNCDVRGHKFMSFATWPRQTWGEPKVKRTTENAVAIGASWVDLDYYNESDWAGCSPLVVLEAVLNICQDWAWPSPSYATCSGRGLLIAWLYPSQPAQAVLARHRAIQETLHQTFRSMGSDPSAKTITKVFRLPQTRNERNGGIVGVIWPALIREIQHTTFDALAEAVLPFRRKTRKEKDAETAAAKAERTAKVLAARKPRKEHAGAKLGGRSYWATLREDLERLHALRHGTGSVPDGEGRNAWILALTYAAAWDMPASALDRYVRDQAARCGLTEAEALDKTVTLRAKAQAAARGERVLKGTRKLDPRYRPAPGYFVELLDIQPREMKQADLRMLVDGARRASNAIGRVVKARRAAGVKDRADQQAHRLQVGRQVVEMVELGMKHADVAALYGASVRWVTNALRDARKVADIGKVTPAPAPSPEPVTEAVIVVDDVAETFDVPASSAAHEVLRGTMETAPEGVVATPGVPYSAGVTTKGCTFPGRTPAASREARRASSCPALP